MKCRHGEFDPAVGCPQCIAERQAEARKAEETATIPEDTNVLPMDADVPGPFIVKVRYSNSAGQVGGRDYTYYSVDQLEVGEFVQVPVYERVQLAVVTQVNVPESEIESFKDRMKTIPSGSRRPAPEPESTQVVDDPMDAPGFEDDLPTEAEIEEAETAVLAESTTEVDVPGTAVIAVEPEDDEAILALFAEGQKALEYAENRIIETNDDLESATNDLVAIKNLREAMEAKRLSFVRPIRSHLGYVDGEFKRLMEPFDKANTVTRSKVNEFRAIEQAKAELQQREAAAKGGVTTIERQEPVSEITRTNLGTAGSRTVWHFEIEDFAQVPDEYKLPNDSKILTHARTTKGERPIPGIKIWSDKEVTVRRRGK